MNHKDQPTEVSGSHLEHQDLESEEMMRLAGAGCLMRRNHNHSGWTLLLRLTADS